MRFLLIGPLALVVAGTAWGVEPKSEPVTVPFEMLHKGRLISGHMAIQVKINGKGPYRLIFDTGAPVMLLSARVGKEAGLFDGTRKQPPPTGFMMPGQVRVAKLEVGAVAAADLNAIVIDHPTVKAIAEVFGPIDGIVGFPFFARYRTAIDYQAKTLTLTPNGFQPADVMQTLLATFMSPARQRTGPPPPRVLAPAALWGLRVEKANDDRSPGVAVAAVFPESPAGRAGVKPGDRLLTLDGRWTDSVADCYLATEDVKPGQPAEILLRRDGKEVKLTVTPTAGL
jgi:Aspartyl protease/PDZ domain